MSTKHTPTPWDFDSTKNEGEYGNGSPDSRVGFDSYQIIDNDGRVIADTLNSGVACVNDSDDESPAFDEVGLENAKFIVRACNAHYELLLVASVVADYGTMLSEGFRRRYSLDADANLKDFVAKLAMAAITKAEGKRS